MRRFRTRRYRRFGTLCFCDHRSRARASAGRLIAGAASGRGYVAGLLTRLITRVYFEDEPSNAADAVLALVPPERRTTLIAKRTGADQYRFDIVLQGPGETVFFDV